MKKIIIILIVISVFILAFAFIANGFFKMFYLKGEENRNADNFTKGEMVKFDHGTEALAFFEKYSDLPRDLAGGARVLQRGLAGIQSAVPQNYSGTAALPLWVRGLYCFAVQ